MKKRSAKKENMISIDRLRLLQFFDEAPLSSSKHATAIVSIAGEELGLALLVDYFEKIGITAQVVGDRCTQGTKKGQRLDGWVEAGDILYQVEVKNWSAHAIGGKVLKVDALAPVVANHRKDRWKEVWDGGGFIHPGANKVLLPMKPPHKDLKIEPLVVFWVPMHPKGQEDPFFRVRVKNSAFPFVNVFSMSNYLRQCPKKRLKLHMPITCKRLAWLSTLFITRNPDGCHE